MTRQTKIRIRKCVAFTRTLFLMLFFMFTALTICSIDSENILFPIVCFVIAMICFGISYFLDWLLWETSWNGDENSPFTH